MLQERLSGGILKKIFVFACGLAAAIFLILFLAGLWVERELGARLNIQIHGKFETVFFSPSFYLRDLRFTWKDKMRFASGDLKVSYHLGRLIGKNILRLEIEGKNLDVEFLQEWANAQGVGKAVLESFYADLDLGPGGLKEIYALDAQSPSFQFRIQRTENKSKSLSSGGEKE